MPRSPSLGQVQAREEPIQGRGTRCFDFCSLVKSSKALGHPTNCLSCSVALSSGVVRAALQCCLEPSEGTNQPVQGPQDVCCHLHFPEALLSPGPVFLFPIASPCWERVVLGVTVAEMVLAAQINSKHSVPLALQLPASRSGCRCLSPQPLGILELVLQCWVSGS